MTIETKYNIGEEVWCSFGGVPIRSIIQDIILVEEMNMLKVAYSVSSTDERIFGTRFESDLFPSKDELLKSLSSMYKSIHNHNYRWVISVNTFPISAKRVSKAYWSGIRWWKHDDNLLSIAFVVYRFRLIFSFPIGRERGCCC